MGGPAEGVKDFAEACHCDSDGRSITLQQPDLIPENWFSEDPGLLTLQREPFITVQGCVQGRKRGCTWALGGNGAACATVPMG